MTDFHRANAVENVDVIMIMTMDRIRMQHTRERETREGFMSEPCMIDPFEECFRDCPNCRRAIYDDNDNIYDDDERDEDEWE